MGKASLGDRFRVAGPVMAMCVCALLLSASQGWATVVDHFQDVFSTGTLTVTSSSGPDTDTTSPITNGLAATTSRQADLTWVSGNVGPNAQALIVLSPHELDYSNGASVKSTLVLTYTFGGNGGASRDVSDGTEFLLLTDSDLGGTSKLYVHSTNGGNHQSSNVLAAGPGLQGFAFTDFTSNGVNLTIVDVIRLTISSDKTGFDCEIDALETGNPVPEPLTMLGLFLGLGSVGAYIRRRRMV